MCSTDAEKNVFQGDSVFKGILAMAVPTVISQMITVLYNYADTVFIGRLNDPVQSAAIALAFPLTMIMTALGNFWGIGGGSTISRALGSGDLRGSECAAAFSFCGAALTTGLCCAAVLVMGDTFVFFLGVSAVDLNYVKGYVLWSFIVGAIPSVLSQVLAHFTRSLGFAREAGNGLTLGGVMNIILDPIFIFPFGFNLGVTGAAIATMLSNVISLSYFGILFFRHRTQWSVSFRVTNARPTRDVAIQILSVGLPSALIPFMSAISNRTLNDLVSSHGEVVVASVGIAKKMDIFPANVAAGITQGSLPLIAYSCGTGEKERTRRLLYTTGILTFAGTSLVVIALEIFAAPAAMLFIQDTETVWYATQFIRRLCVAVPLYSITVTINSFFQAVNRPQHALAISLIRKGTFDLPLMLFFDAHFSVISIIWVQPIMDLAAAAVSLTVIWLFLQKNDQKAAIT